MSDVTYAAAIDPAIKNSDFALAVAHRTSTGLIVLDCEAFWTGSKRAPLGFEWVCRQVVDIHQRYASSLERALDRMLTQYERAQRIRKGQPLPPQLDVKIS